MKPGSARKSLTIPEVRVRVRVRGRGRGRVRGRVGALLVHLQVDRAKLAVQLAPILRVGRAAHLVSSGAIVSSGATASSGAMGLAEPPTSSSGQRGDN